MYDNLANLLKDVIYFSLSTEESAENCEVFLELLIICKKLF